MDFFFLCCCSYFDSVQSCSVVDLFLFVERMNYREIKIQEKIYTQTKKRTTKIKIKIVN